MYNNWDETKLAWNNRPVWYDEFVNFTVKKSDSHIQLDLTRLFNDKEKFYTDTISIIIVADSRGRSGFSSEKKLIKGPSNDSMDSYIF